MTEAPNPIRHIKVGDFEIGNDLPLTLIAGPCAMESREHALDMAGSLKDLTEKLGINFVYKSSYDKANRISIRSNRGFGLENAIPVFDEIRDSLGLPVITDVHTEEQAREVAPHVDILQVPAFLSRQTDLLLACASTGKVVNVKKGQFLAPWDMKNVVEKFDHAGNPNVMLCERGVSFGYNTLVNDMRALPIMAETGCPVVFDATHSVQQPGGKGTSSGGDRRFVPILARGAVAIGVAAVFMETHKDPDSAPSDGPNMVPFHQMEAVLEQLLEFDHLAKAGH
ncbi:MAG: 3-deoxy-8-phosphooctulonate synthase [Ferrovibrio sp.]|uniref:3-deoxy-8-phosphooctulonate synthase n=1 Tax=Ferrovibrio TaxID=1231242 RepID=UPI002621CE39|nr:3-deoxy-8-phosphooctulonate synthase [Ferrovibrio sp.]MCW0231993.1 3-deoxy-8-phosphooctulonate synthase [Ferrovibrio sp.]